MLDVDLGKLTCEGQEAEEVASRGSKVRDKVACRGCAMSGLGRGPEGSGLGKSLREKTEGTDMLEKKWSEPIGRLESKLW